MKVFAEKSAAERERFWVGFGGHLTGGLVITDQDVTAEVYDKSSVVDPAFEDIIDGSATLNTAEITIDGETIAAGEAVGIWIQGGVTGCTYVLTFKPVLSDGATPIEQVILPIKKYVPVN